MHGGTGWPGDCSVRTVKSMGLQCSGHVSSFVDVMCMHDLLLLRLEVKMSKTVVKGWDRNETNEKSVFFFLILIFMFVLPEPLQTTVRIHSPSVIVQFMFPHSFSWHVTLICLKQGWYFSFFTSGPLGNCLQGRKECNKGCTPVSFRRKQLIKKL